MASIFTFDPSPPAVSSPWSTPRTSTPQVVSASNAGAPPGVQVAIPARFDPNSSAENIIVTSLEAEPQEGPTEYKLHLLLRTRRDFLYSSTQGRISGSMRTTSDSMLPVRGTEGLQAMQSSQLSVSTQNTRQNRLEHLTTQLLWRLQQTSAYHYTTYKQTPMPSLVSLDSEPQSPKPVFPGLEDSKGALYELGVADDGTFVGLAEDELEESLQTLRTMAASLGCVVTVLKRVAVGDCQWIDDGASPLAVDPSAGSVRGSRLWVAEAYVRPNFGHAKPQTSESETDKLAHLQPLSVISQLRITLTGATMSGKSSLLGTLTTATFDNGRGKSRLSLLRHQHEIASGMTSSVTHELLGYTAPDSASGDVQVINFACGNVTSWIDVHASCEEGRLIFFSDSAGHPRFRRTTVRGLVGWAPHWMILCIPADTLEDTSGRLGNTPPSHETLRLPSLDRDLSQDHLELCLKLNVPLVVVITKIDLASRSGLKTYLNKILSILKRNGRQPFILRDYSQTDMSVIAKEDLTDMAKTLTGLKENPHLFVPIVLVSAVKGSGIKTLHALLHELPIPSTPEPTQGGDNRVTALFDIEDTYTGREQEGRTIILSGAVRLGQISVGDELSIGPFQTKPSMKADRHPNRPRPQLRSLVGPLTESASTQAEALSSNANHEWVNVRVCSARHLRLPTHSLAVDQVGTIGVVPMHTETHTAAWRAVRKGMILCNGAPVASRLFFAQFARGDVDPLSIGSAVVVYFNSVRASAKIIAGAIIASDESMEQSEDEEAFPLDEEIESKGERGDEQLIVTFRFLASREYVAIGSRVLVMPGGATYGGSSRGEKGLAGLDGFVGHVVEGAIAGYSAQARAPST